MTDELPPPPPGIRLMTVDEYLHRDRPAEPSWAAFFKEHMDYRVESHFYECRNSFTLEEMYQAFKARLDCERKEEGSP